MSEGYKLYGGNGVEIEPLEVSEDGTYTAPMGKAFNPVKVSGGGGAGGGSVILMTVNPETGIADKTWQEVHDAAMTGNIVVWLYETVLSGDIPATILLTLGYVQDDYTAAFLGSDGVSDVGFVLQAQGNSADGYLYLYMD